MAHQLNFNRDTQKHAFFSVKEKAWHGLGTVVDGYPTSAQALKFAGLDYTVVKRPLFTLDNLNNEFRQGQILPAEAGVEVPDFYATMRTDTEQVLGVVGKDYGVVQNVDAFSFFDSIVGGGDGIRYETAGALGKGERIFITAKLPSYIRVGKDDLIEQYLFLTTSHDGGGSITAAFTPVRIVCNNTLNAAMRNHKNAVRIRHSSGAGDRLKQAHILMGISNSLAGETEKLFNYWSKVRISDAEVKKLIQIAMAPGKEVLQKLQNGADDENSAVYRNIVEEVYGYAMGNATQQTATTAGTVFGAYNAVTGYFQNVRRFRDGEAKFKSITEGTAKQRAQVAFDLCGDLADGRQLGFN